MSSAATGGVVESKGLAGIYAGETKVASVEQGQLLYRGYDIHDLAEKATFEEVAYLLLVGEKPTEGELAAFADELKSYRKVPGWVLDVVRQVAVDSHPMDTLRTGVSLLSHADAETGDHSPEAELRKAKRLVAQIPVIIGTGQRAIDGQGVVDADETLGHAANLLWMMTGEKPSELLAKTMDVSLILYAEHEFNASTFTCRVIAGTLSDMHSAVCGGIGALKGPLHGGANEAAMSMLREVGEVENVRSFMDNAFATKRKIMGFGHRVYKSGDHRAPILKSWGLKLAEERAEFKNWFAIGEAVQRIMEEEKGIYPNVDFPCGMTYFTMGVPVAQYTPIFVASRVTGWCAHIMEQHGDNRLIRPLSRYTGAEKREW